MDGEITPEEVHDLLADGADVCVVDIRDAASYAHAHIEDSTNVPFHELPARVEELAGPERIVTVCPHGKASIQAARLIKSYEGSADATVESMAGGLEEWAASYELASESTPALASDSDSSSAENEPEGPSPPF